MLQCYCFHILWKKILQQKVGQHEIQAIELQRMWFGGKVVFFSPSFCTLGAIFPYPMLANPSFLSSFPFLLLWVFASRTAFPTVTGSVANFLSQVSFQPCLFWTFKTAAILVFYGSSMRFIYCRLGLAVLSKSWVNNIIGHFLPLITMH